MKRIIKITLICITSLLVFAIIGFYLIYYTPLSWYAYEEWKYRTGTRGDKQEAITRKVFIKDLNYKSTIELKDFTIYIERGFRFGYHGYDETRFVEDGNYRYQVSLNHLSSPKESKEHYIVFEINNPAQFDSINPDSNAISVFLKEPHLKDTITLKIINYYAPRDSIGYVKIWE